MYLHGIFEYPNPPDSSDLNYLDCIFVGEFCIQLQTKIRMENYSLNQLK